MHFEFHPFRWVISKLLYLMTSHFTTLEPNECISSSTTFTPTYTFNAYYLMKRHALDVSWCNYIKSYWLSSRVTLDKSLHNHLPPVDPTSVWRNDGVHTFWVVQWSSTPRWNCPVRMYRVINLLYTILLPIIQPIAQRVGTFQELES